MSLLDKTLMIELAEALTRRGSPVDEKAMLDDLDPTVDDYRDLVRQFHTGKLKSVWSVDVPRNYWRPTTSNVWGLPFYGFLGTAVGLYQPIPYLVAWMGNYGPWLDMYDKGEDLFSAIGEDLKVDRDQGREAFYRYIYGLSQPQVEIKYPWLAEIREGMRERAALSGYIETGFGTKCQVSQLDMSLSGYLDQVVRDVIRIGTLTLYKDFGYVPYGIFPDSVVVPNSVCSTYAEALAEASQEKFSFSVVMERLGPV
jgi:hypothetical protein